MALSIKVFRTRFYPIIANLKPQVNLITDGWPKEPFEHHKHLSTNTLTCLKYDFTNQFRQLYPPERQNKKSMFLEKYVSPTNFSKGLPKSFGFRKKTNNPKSTKKRVPKLILVQNPITWLMNKIDFSVLRNVWDSSFQEKEFKYGTKQVGFIFGINIVYLITC